MQQPLKITVAVACNTKLGPLHLVPTRPTPTQPIPVFPSPSHDTSPDIHRDHRGTFSCKAAQGSRYFYEPEPLTPLIRSIERHHFFAIHPISDRVSNLSDQLIGKSESVDEKESSPLRIHVIARIRDANESRFEDC